jgi:hypothetical protein
MGRPPRRAGSPADLGAPVSGLDWPGGGRRRPVSEPSAAGPLERLGRAMIMIMMMTTTTTMPLSDNHHQSTNINQQIALLTCRANRGRWLGRSRWRPPLLLSSFFPVGGAVRVLPSSGQIIVSKAIIFNILAGGRPPARDELAAADGFKCAPYPPVCVWCVSRESIHLHHHRASPPPPLPLLPFFLLERHGCSTSSWRHSSWSQPSGRPPPARSGRPAGCTHTHAN